jgi:hypothetical protein
MFLRGVSVEITIATAMRAKRDVDVEAKGSLLRAPCHRGGKQPIAGCNVPIGKRARRH